MGKSAERRQLEERCREELEQAKQHLLNDPSDKAQEEFERALRVFTDLVVRNIAPK
jgi:hypothetical protein